MRHVVGREDTTPVGTVLPETGVDRAGTDRHDPHVVPPHLKHERLREPQHGVLRRTVGGAALDTVLAGERGDVDDSATARVHHGLEEGPGDEIQGAHVHADGLVPVLERQIHEGLEAADSGIVHEDARGASLAHERRERVHAGRVGDVARHAERVDPRRREVAHRRVHVRLRAGADGDAGPGAPQGERRGTTDPRGRAGHDGERAGNVHIRSKYTAPRSAGRGEPCGVLQAYKEALS